MHASIIFQGKKAEKIKRKIVQFLSGSLDFVV